MNNKLLSTKTPIWLDFSKLLLRTLLAALTVSIALALCVLVFSQSGFYDPQTVTALTTP